MNKLDELDMNTSNNNHLNILDLPNEILLVIFKKLNMVDVLYSLVDINERFNHLVLGPLYISKFDITTMAMKSFFDGTYSIDNQVLDRICKKILPRIHHQIKELTVEQHSMERILLTANYPQLYSLSLIDFEEMILWQYLAEDNSILYRVLNQQITHLKIDIHNNAMPSPLSATISVIFALILSCCKRLIDLNFCQLFEYRTSSICIFNLPSRSCTSSTLNTLRIDLATFDDCLYLLDGRLDSLSTLIVNVIKISFTTSTIDNTKKLPKLKHFSLTSFNQTFHYESLIIPLLRRMINLEELKLFLSVLRVNSTYIDGIQLHDEILVYLPRLNKFSFSIDVCVINKNIRIDLASNEDIQRSFIGKGYGQVGSYVYTIPMEDQGISHIYSLPFEFEEFLQLNNCFQGGMFDKVRRLVMIDSSPFEHQFFKVVSQDFPLLKELYIFNDEPQKDKQHSSTLIIFPHLVYLSLDLAHVDYAEQLLLEKNTHLPRLMDLSIKYKALVMVTNNFTNDGARLNCAKLIYIDIHEPFARSENFDQYLPLL